MKITVTLRSEKKEVARILENLSKYCATCPDPYTLVGAGTLCADLTDTKGHIVGVAEIEE